jgi:hypothetical protein
MRLAYVFFASCLLSATASAGPVIWTLNGITFNGGGTASGSFTFDADTGSHACSSALTPCGTFSNINITTTTGAGVTGSVYTHACGVDVIGCTAVSPDSTEVLFLTSTAADQTGLPAIAFFFAGAGVVPPGGLTDAGGVMDVSGSSSSVGVIQEALCNNAGCASPAAPSRVGNAGSVVGVAAVPEPSSALYLTGALALLGFARLRKSS